uniref:Uncharacterized protein n=1 Tax=Cacopsylla melanoneura TaxID=428564 RepID=A0A8D8SZI8_9HEMI
MKTLDIFIFFSLCLRKNFFISPESAFSQESIAKIKDGVLYLRINSGSLSQNPYMIFIEEFLFIYFLNYFCIFSVLLFSYILLCLSVMSIFVSFFLINYIVIFFIIPKTP